MQTRPFETSLQFQVKSYDVDYVGYVHNIVYIRWLEDLRLAMLEPYFSIQQCVESGISPIILRTCIDYKKPLRLSDGFTGSVWVSSLEGVRWGVQHELMHNGTIIATAEQSGIFINLQTHRPVPVPKELEEKYLVLVGKPASQ